MNPPIAQVRDPYLTHRGCLVREKWTPLPGGVWNQHVELSGAGMRPQELIEQQRAASC